MVWILSILLSLVLLAGLLVIVFPEIMHITMPDVARRWARNFHYRNH